MTALRTALPLAFALAALLGCGQAPKTTVADVNRDEADILRMLHDQQDAWNRGDLDGFMQGYWKSDDLTFASGKDVTKGWQPTFDRYKKRYQADGKEMGRLAFTDLAVSSDGAEAATVTGRFHLTMSDGKTPKGGFKLLVRKFADGWKIVRDDTTADP